MNSSAKSWTYTINNYTEDDLVKMQQLECNFHVCGKEVGENGTPHLQGMITFNKSTRLGPLKLINPKAHWERCISAEAAANYCMKENIAWKIDNRRQGKQNRYGSCNCDSQGVWCTGCGYGAPICVCEIWNWF